MDHENLTTCTKREKQKKNLKFDIHAQRLSDYVVVVVVVIVFNNNIDFFGCSLNLSSPRLFSRYIINNNNNITIR